MPELDPETMPLEELMALANAEPTEEVVEPVQPRNPDGTFASPETVSADAEIPPVTEGISAPTPPTSFSRTIDLGDGSGAQVFTADSLEGLVDKLADAQKHATRKIRELNQVAKQVPKAPARKELTADEKYLLGQRLINEPDVALRELLEAELGMTFDEFKTSTVQARQITKEKVELAQVQQWLTKNPDFHNVDANAQKMHRYINRFCEGGMTQDNLDLAYASLHGDGLLAAKPVAAPPVVVPPAAPRARASSLSSRISTVTPPTSGPTEADLYKMPMHELEALANGHKL